MNKWIKLIISSMLIAFFTSTYGEIETITIQQGLDGYSGCLDTYLIGEDGSDPQGDTTELTLHGYH